MDEVSRWEHEQLIAVLRTILKKLPPERTGLCAMVSRALSAQGLHRHARHEEAYELFDSMLRRWCIESDVPDPLFPIEGSFSAYSEPGKWEGERGAARRKMTRDIINMLEEELNS